MIPTVHGKGAPAAPFEHEHKDALLIEMEKLGQIGHPTATFDQLRERLALTKADLPDGVIQQIALDAGYRVT